MFGLFLISLFIFFGAVILFKILFFVFGVLLVGAGFIIKIVIACIFIPLLPLLFIISIPFISIGSVTLILIGAVVVSLFTGSERSGRKNYN